jgi:DNA-binding MarR family transcriptional regulator
VATPSAETRELASDLVMYAARLVRGVRRTQQLPASTRILSVIDEYGALGISQLAAADRSSQPSMSAAVNQLLDQGLVDKQPNPEDGRGSVVTLTESGSLELARLRRDNGHMVAARVTRAGHTPEELATAVAVLRDALATDEKGTA